MEIAYKDAGSAALNSWGSTGTSLGGAFTLQWSSEGGATETIPTTRLFSAAHAAHALGVSQGDGTYEIAMVRLKSQKTSRPASPKLNMNCQVAF